MKKIIKLISFLWIRFGYGFMMYRLMTYDYIFLLLASIWKSSCSDPSTRIILPQGSVTGINIFTESRVKLNGYLGIPYALPPIGDLRFAPPERHPGWNKTLFAGHFRPDCPQIVPEDQDPETTATDEDCLYLNIFVPEVAMTYRDFPVVIFLHGIDYVSGSPLIITAEDLASEGIIVVTVSYRLNIFGFLTFEDEYSRGNLGLLDQYMAFMWVRENIQYFGGVPDQITAMGHGSGASSILIHMTSPRTKDLFQRVILMSGSIFSPWLRSSPTSESTPVERTSRRIARSLGCYGENFPQRNSLGTRSILSCMRSKSKDEILRAFQNAYMNGNWTDSLGPIADDFLPPRSQYLPSDPTEAIAKGNYHRLPILAGITCNEGTLALNNWKGLISQNEENLRYFIENTAVTNILTKYGLNSTEIRYLVTWNYVTKVQGDTKLIHQLVKLYNEAVFVAPFWLQLQILSSTSPQNPMFVYQFTQPTFDYLGNYVHHLNLTASAHGSELVILFGPTLFEKVANRRFSQSEERLSLRMKRLWTYFIRTGNPTPPSYGYSLWDKFNSKDENYLKLYIDPDTGINLLKLNGNPNKEATTFWNTLLPALYNITEENIKKLEQSLIFTGATNINLAGSCSSYKNAMFTTLAFLIVLLFTLVLSLILLKKRTKERDRSIL